MNPGEHRVKIKVNNVENGDRLLYSLAFLKGEAECCLCNSNQLNGAVYLGTSKDVKWPVRNGKLKLLCQLNIGSNNLVLNYEDEEGHKAHFSIELFHEPVRCRKVVRLVYVIPKGDSGSFQSMPKEVSSPNTACDKIRLGALVLQTLTAERLHEEGLGRKTFQLERDALGSATCHVFHSRYTKEHFWSRDGNQIWEDLAREMLNAKLVNEHSKVLAFLSCTHYSWSRDVPLQIKTKDDFQKAVQNTKAYVACGTGNFALLGSASLHSWPASVKEIHECFTSKEMVDTKMLLDDSGFRGTIGGCYASSLGSALHELGHTFDLVHSKEGIMARGFDDIDSFFVVKGTSEGQPGNVSITVSNIQTKKRQQLHDGEAYWNRSSAVLLSGHSWFNEEREPRDLGPPFVKGMEVHSPNGLRLIELRMENDFTLKYWEFVRNARPVKIFRLSYADCSDKKICIYVQDTLGNSIKHQIHF